MMGNGAKKPSLNVGVTYLDGGHAVYIKKCDREAKPLYTENDKKKQDI